MRTTQAASVLFHCAGLAARELFEADVPRMQRFFDASEAYFRIISGASAPLTEARDEFDSRVPADWPQGRKWIVGFDDAGGELAGLAILIADLFARGVWHLGLFMVAQPRWGSGGPLYRELEVWMRGRGAHWLRLGVVAGNPRGERFWRREGYVETRRREGFMVGTQVNQLIVMVKLPEGGSLEEYLALVPRDWPGAPWRSSCSITRAWRVRGGGAVLDALRRKRQRNVAGEAGVDLQGRRVDVGTRKGRCHSGL